MIVLTRVVADQGYGCTTQGGANSKTNNQRYTKNPRFHCCVALDALEIDREVLFSDCQSSIDTEVEPCTSKNASLLQDSWRQCCLVLKSILKVAEDGDEHNRCHKKDNNDCIVPSVFGASPL